MKKRKSIILVVALITIVSILLFFTMNERKWSFLVNSNNKTSTQQKLDTGQPQDNQVTQTTETRSVEINPDKEFIVDKDKNSFKTNEKGIIKGNISYIHSTLKDEQRVVYAFLENDDKPLKIEINGTLAPHHIIDVPKEGTKKIPFTVSDLPPGEHMLYIISEKILDDNINDPLEVSQTQKAVAGNYLSIDVHNKNKGKSTSKKVFKRTQDSQEIEKETSLVMQMYEDSNLTKEVESINKDNYFLTIENPYDFELNAQLKLVSEYVPLDLQQVILPSKSKVVVPINFKDLNISKSLRILMVGTPSKKSDTPFQLRVVKKTNRYLVEN
ncbi:hypothetical protein ACQKML_08130 [Peribacillus frigoritolerans]